MRSVVNYEFFDSILHNSDIGDGEKLVLDEEIKKVLNNIDIEGITTEDFLSFIKSIIKDVDIKREVLLDLISKLGSDNNMFSIVKYIMTSESRKLVHDDKLLATNNVFSYGRVATDSGNFLHEMTRCTADYNTNFITMAKIITPYNKMNKLFSIEVEKCSRDLTKSYNNIGKVLLELNISTPVSSFKGYMTSGLLTNNTYGIGFLADVSVCSDKNPLILTAYKVGNTIHVYASKFMEDATNTIYDTMLPCKIDISVLIGTNLNIDQSISLTDNVGFGSVQGSEGCVGCGSLNIEGHGPIDVSIIDIMDRDKEKSRARYIKSLYYPPNTDNSTCNTTVVSNKKHTSSSILNIKISPLSYNSAFPSKMTDSHLLKNVFDNSNVFDCYNLFNTIHDFISNRLYRCEGYILVRRYYNDKFNLEHRLVDSIKVDKENGYVEFFLDKNSYYKTNSRNDVSLKFYSNSLPNAYRYNHSGFKHNTDISLIDIMVHIGNIETSTIKSISGPIRYSGDYNKFKRNFGKHSFDTYPYPNIDKESREKFKNSINGNPSLNPVTQNIVFSDGTTMTYSDGSPIKYTDNKNIK